MTGVLRGLHVRTHSFPTRRSSDLLAFEELLTHQLSQQRLRESLRSLRAPAMPKAKDLPARYLANLGFAPTGAQQRVGNEIAYDLSQPDRKSTRLNSSH